MPKATSLFIVPTPIGNLDDITLRALQILKQVDLILAEDTRTSGKLLKHFGIQTPMQSYHAFNEHGKLESLLRDLKLGKTMAIISDAGTPGISDPGFLLVRACVQQDIELETLPGATALIPALINSGFATDRFIFEGFLPHKKGRQTRLKALAQEDRTVVLYESPHRLLKCLQQLSEVLEPQRLVSVSRELSKLYEETITGTLEEVIHHFNNKKAKGEFVIVIEGKTKSNTND